MVTVLKFRDQTRFWSLILETGTVLVSIWSQILTPAFQLSRKWRPLGHAVAHILRPTIFTVSNGDRKTIPLNLVFTFETVSEGQSQIETEFGGPVSIADQNFIPFGL